MQTEPLLSIVIPVHNQSALTRGCLASLLHYPPAVAFEIIVVDDGSTDDTRSVVTAFAGYDSRIRMVRNEPPHRFARACNRGAQGARGELLLLLNNDTEVLAGWSAPLLSALEMPSVGIVAPKLIFPDGTIQHCGKVWGDITTEHAHPHHIYYRFPKQHPAVNKSREYQVVTGACMLLRSDDFRAWGGFDERYENGWEDDDLCYQCHRHAKKIWYCAESEIIHHQNKTLNEQLDALKARLPSIEELRRLDASLQSGIADGDDIRRASHVQNLYQNMISEMSKFRKKFDANRALFFSKWGAVIRQDDYRYCHLDVVPLHQALPELYKQ
jgi:GT2 family glycosyltransferase